MISLRITLIYNDTLKHNEYTMVIVHCRKKSQNSLAFPIVLWLLLEAALTLFSYLIFHSMSQN